MDSNTTAGGWFRISPTPLSEIEWAFDGDEETGVHDANTGLPVACREVDGEVRIVTFAEAGYVSACFSLRGLLAWVRRERPELIEEAAT